MSDNLYFPAYFRDWNAIREAVTPEQGWALFTLCLDYAAGEASDPGGDPILSAFFKLLTGGIDRSKLAQEEKNAKRRYARYCGLMKDSGQEPLGFDEWRKKIDDCLRLSTNVNITDNPIEIQSESKSESKSKSGDRAASPPTRTRFVPPSVEEIADYCHERQNGIDARRFFDYYEANGWTQGRGKPIRDWRAAVRTWERGDGHAGQNDSSYGADAADTDIIEGITRL